MHLRDRQAQGVKLFKKTIAALFGLTGLFAATAAHAVVCPTFVFGLVLSAQQWQACFDQKQNVLTFPPVNKNGDIMSGALGIAASTSSIAGINIAPGTPPSSPKDGDVFVTASGIFVRINGATVGPLISGFNTLTANALVLGNGAAAPITLGSLGTTVTVLHGNASGVPSWSAVNLATDTTGTLPAASLPAPSASTLGGVKSLAPTTHKWINQISTAGLPVATQPDFTDITGLVAAAQLPNPGASSLGGVQSKTCASSTFMSQITTLGVVNCAQPAFADLSGTLSGGQLPLPGPSSLGGIQSFTKVLHSYIDVISTSGVPSASRPGFTDLTGVVSHSQLIAPGTGTLGAVLDTLCAANNWATGYDHSGAPVCSQPAFTDISGAVGASQLPTPTASTLGGVQSLTLVTHDFLTFIGTDGVVHQAQPAFTDISGSVAAAQLPNPSASTLGGVKSLVSVPHLWINQISTGGLPSATQPAFTDISGSVAAAQLPNPTATTLGGVKSLVSTPHLWINHITTGGLPFATQPAFSDISGVAVGAQLPLPSAGVLGGISADDCASGEYAMGVTTGGIVHCAAVDFSQVTGTIAGGQLPDPTTITLGGVFALQCSAGQFIYQITTLGAPVCAQDSFSQLSGTADLTTQVAGILPHGNGGTENAFFKVTGPATAVRTFTFPNASSTILTSHALVTVPEGGSGLATATFNGVLYGQAVSAFGVTATNSTATNEYLHQASDGTPSFQQVAAADISGLGTAAVVNTGTSGTKIPLLNGTNTWSNTQAFADISAGTVTISGDIFTSGSAPVVSACGSSPLITIGSTDTAGEVTPGGSATSCTITWANFKANKPFCTVTASLTVRMNTYDLSTTNMILGLTGLGGYTVNWTCNQH